jgi:type IV secretion system protein VirB2
VARWLATALLAFVSPHSAMAADSPFATGVTAAQVSLLTVLTPIAAIAVMVSGTFAWFGRISWWWLVGVVVGTVLVFGAPQIVTWIRTMFSV